MLQRLRETPEARVTWLAAKALGRDPLEALGVTTGTLTPERAMFVLDMEDPKAQQEREEMRQALDVKATLDAEDSWEDALPGGRGYSGPRTTSPEVSDGE